MKVIQPSPTAASLGVYGNNPVNYYNGTVGVTVPLYEIKTASHTLPIKLSYFSTGVRPADNASWVGLGWSLSAGGVITKTVRGSDDLFGTASTAAGYYNADALPDKHTVLSTDFYNLSTPYQNYLYYFDQGAIDADPDFFNYNFNNYSGKFVLTKLVDGSAVYKDEKNNLRMQYLQATDNWVVTDASGFKYYFNTRERTQDYRSSSEQPNDAQIGTFDNYTVSNPFITTSWYLDSVVAPNGETISFVYQSQVQVQSVSLTSNSESEYDVLTMDNRAFPTNDPRYSPPTLSAVYRQNNSSKQVTLEVYLKQINFSGGSIEFNTTDRDDVEYMGTNKPQKLSEIIVKDLNNNQLKKYNLSYSNFISSVSTALNNDYTNKRRLKLDAVVETGADGQVRPPYAFNYYNAGDLPYKYTKAIDHWGYYNGKTQNNTLLPAKVVPGVQKFWKGADRSADQTDANMVKGTLSSISYPTGGSTIFNYELNEYGNLKGEDQYTYAAQSALANSILNRYTISFDIATIDTPVVSFTTTFKKSGDITYVGDYAHIYKDGNQIYQFSETSMQPSGQYLNPQTAEFILYPGHYTMDIRNIDGITMAIRANWDARTLMSQKKGGGLRIAKITNMDNNATVTGIKKYLYNSADATTNGRLITPIRYDFPIFVTEMRIKSTGASDPVHQNFYDFQYVARMSNSIPVPNLSMNAGVIGYNSVTELDGENGENGKTEYYYTNTEDVLSSSSFPYIPVIHNPKNGKLNKVVISDASGHLMKKTEYQYTLKETRYLQGITKAPTLPVTSYGLGFPSNYVNTANLRYYNTASYWVVPSVEADTLYDKNQNKTIITKKSYYDDYSHLNITKSETILSDESTKVSLYKYPNEMVSENRDPNGVYQAMVTANVIQPVIEESTSLNGKTNLVRTNYTQLSAGLFTPASVEGRNTITGNDEFRLRYHDHDTKGNPLAISKENGSKTCYVWSYNAQYPVAEIKNAELSAIVAVLGGQSAVDVFSAQTNPDVNAFLAPLRSGLPNAQITSYTYKPLVGMTSSTDAKGMTTYYEYDAFQHLKTVKDQNGNILKQTNYHYKN
ncbi:hypothetical protein DBR40_01065 [Pedobacter sp. KBW01]|nr:hypothetical protein DBR40_01065 [Pedobacter sp. KBW01]